MRKRLVQLLFVILIGYTAILQGNHLLSGRVGEGSAPAQRAVVALSLIANPKSLITKPFVPPVALSSIQNPKLKIQNVYGRLPLSFEANQGQTDPRVKFLSQGRGYSLFLTGSEVVLTLRKASVIAQPRGLAGPPAAQPDLGPQPKLCVPVVGVRLAVPSSSCRATEQKGTASRTPTTGTHDLFAKKTRIYELALQLPLFGGAALPDFFSLSMPKGKPEKEVEKLLDRRAGPALPPSHRADSRANSAVLRMRLVDGKAKARIVGLDELPGRSNYFIGNDPKKWRTDVPSYTRVKYEGVYPGIDLVYYGNQRELEYDFVVAPGADPDQIKLRFVGADGMRVDPASGDLVLNVGNDEVRLQNPTVYQPAVAAVSSLPSPSVAPISVLEPRHSSLVTRHSSRDVRHSSLITRHCSFVLASNNEVAFRVAGYDPKRALVIDPVLSYSTYLGGSEYDAGHGVAVDNAGNAYVTGETESTDFPSFDSLQTANRATPNSGLRTAFVAKVNTTASALVFSTYLGGSNSDQGLGIAVDAAGNAYVTGRTTSTDFPTVDPWQASCPACRLGLSEAFVAKLNAAGSALVYSTYLGGSGNAGGNGDYGSGIAVDAAGNAYVTGQTYSTDFPTVNPLQRTCGGCINGYNAGDAFVAKLNPAGGALVYSTYLGGSSYDVGKGIAVDSAGNAYVTGDTSSVDFPTAQPLQAGLGAGAFQNAFVAKLNPSGSALLYSTYLGGSSYDYCRSIAADAAGNAYVAGRTQSTDFPTANPLQAACPACSLGLSNAFAAKLNAAGSALVYSTYLGGSGGEGGNGIALDAAGDAYVTGYTKSTDFPTANPLQPNCLACAHNLSDAFVSKLNPAGSGLVYSTYLGGSGNLGGSADYGLGIAVDAVGDAYVTGLTHSADFPTVHSLPANGDNYSAGKGDAFVAKVSDTGSVPDVSLSSSSLSFPAELSGTSSAAQTVTLTNTGKASLTISSIAASGNFSQTNTCGTTVSAGANCTISVIFTPSSGGALTGSIVVSDNAAGDPQTIALSGMGQDFTLAVASGSTPSANVEPGKTATYNLSLAGEGGLNQAVTFTCTGAPSEANCTVSPNPLTAANYATTIKVSVATTEPSTSAPRSRPHSPDLPFSPNLRSILLLTLFLSAIVWAIGRRNPLVVSRLRATLALLALGLSLALTLAGCGGGGGGPTSPGTPAGAYTLTVTGTVGSGPSALSHSVTLKLQVGAVEYAY